jgi:hypothetical protein
MIKWFIFSILFFVSACGTGQRKNIQEYYVPSGTVKYFLPEVSTWHNYSQTASCFREEVVKTLDFEELKKSFGIEYEKAVQLQIGFNQERINTLKRTDSNILPLREEERLFFATSDKVQSNVKFFKAPKFSRVHVVWVDPTRNKPALQSSMRQFIASDIMALGYPVFVSLCMTSTDLSRYVRLKFKIGTFKVIGFEALNQFNQKSKRVPGEFIHFDELFPRKTKLYFHSTSGIIPKEFIGKFRKL